MNRPLNSNGRFVKSSSTPQEIDNGMNLNLRLPSLTDIIRWIIYLLCS